MNHDDKTVSVTEAAAMFGVSEKTIRRRIKAGELFASKQPLDGGGISWRVLLHSAMDTDVDSVSDIAMDTRRNRTGQRSGQGGGQTHAQTTSATDKAMDVPDNSVDSSVARDGTGTDRAMDNGVDGSAPSFIPFTDDKKLSDRDADEIARQREEIIFLRGLVEQHQRSEAELRASLREALRAMPKQLTAAPAATPTEASTPTTPKASGAQQIANANNVPNATPNAVKSPPARTPRPLWKLMFGIK